MSVQLLQACCCGGECGLFSRPCVDGGNFLVVSDDAQHIAVGAARAFSFFNTQPSGCYREGSAFAEGQFQPGLGSCRTNPGIIVEGSVEMLPAGGGNCSSGNPVIGFVAAIDWRAFLDGSLESARVDAGFNTTGGGDVVVQFPNTFGQIADGTTTVDVAWFSQGGVVGANVTVTTDRENDFGDRFFGVAQFQCYVIGMVPPTPGTPIEICPPSVPPFIAIVPPEWFNPTPGSECPPGCAPGPIGFAAPVSGLSEGGIPTQEEWELSGNIWGCSQGITLQCSPQLTVFAIVPCGAPVSPDQFQGLCDIFGPGGAGLSLPLGGANQSTGCANCGNGGVL